MRSIVTFSPFQELHRFADMMDRMWDSDLLPNQFGPSFPVPMDVWEEDNSIFIKAAVPGMDPNNVELSVEGGVLTLSGEFKDQHENQSESRKMYHREVRYGRFTRSITLPEDADQENIDAEYRDGLLTVRIPRKRKAEATQPKKLQIRTGQQGSPKSLQANQMQSSSQSQQPQQTQKTGSTKNNPVT